MRKQASFGRTDKSLDPSSKPARSGIHPALFYAMFALLLGGNGLLGTAFLLSPDIAHLLNGQTEQVVEAYEDRIAQLRVEVDRLKTWGFNMAIYPGLGFSVAAEAMRLAWVHLKDNGTSNGVTVPQYRSMHELMGFAEVWDFDKRWAT